MAIELKSLVSILRKNTSLVLHIFVDVSRIRFSPTTGSPQLLSSDIVPAFIWCFVHILSEEGEIVLFLLACVEHAMELRELLSF